MTSEKIQALLEAAFTPSRLEVIDEGAMHASHAHADAGHFRVIIRSSAFAGKTRLEAHRMVYTVLEPYLKQGIHALAIDAKLD